MNSSYSFTLFSSVAELPAKWNELAASTIFLTKEYLEDLERSSPTNMTCHYIGLYHESELIGIALSQFLDINQLTSFGERDKCIKTSVRNFVFKNFCSHVLFIGNNMLTGQNAYAFAENTDENKAIATLKKAADALKLQYKKLGKKIHITSFKDFEETIATNFKKVGFTNHYQFSTQPNMVFDIPSQWKSNDDYIAALSKKYRDQYKRARKKSADVIKRKLHLDDIVKYEDAIYDLYFHVAKNAPFNTFFLAKNHFRVFKEIMKDQFLFYGYFLEDKLIGFNTLIKNGSTIDTYFLGYDDSIQKEKMLYLNMLYDMIAYSINKGFKEIIFARTALEIKSSVGAKPQEMFGFIKHEMPIIDRFMPQLFTYLEPETVWQERNPFK